MGQNTDCVHRDDANGSIGGHASSAPTRQGDARSVDRLKGADGRAALPQRLCSGAPLDASRLRSRNEALGGVGVSATTENSPRSGIGAFSRLMGTTALVIVASSGAALAAECRSESPPPPPPIQKFATNTTPTAEVLNNNGVAGCTGGDRFINGGGGQGGGDATQDTKAPPGTLPAKRTAPVGALSNGGDGGRGLSVQSGGISSATAGRGGAGGAGAVASQTFSGEIDDSSRGASVIVSAKGGDGGDGGRAVANAGFSSSTGGAGGAGGVSGRANLEASLITRKATLLEAIAVSIQADGGDGGDGGDAVCCGGTARGGAGGVGGNSLGAKVVIDGFNRTDQNSNVNQGAIIATARGGDGGDGGDGNAGDNKPGSGGRGGAGGDLTVVLGTATRIVTASDGALPAGVFVHSNGGAGGAGGDVRQSIGTGGGAGIAGSGGTVQTSINGLLQTTGANMHGALVQSVGGGGGDGGSSQGFFFGKGVPGQNGGDGGSVTITTDDIPNASGANGRVRVFGRNAVGLLAQSIGGGGGAAGDVTEFAPGLPAVAIGANGGAGGAGGPVEVTLGQSFITSASPNGAPIDATKELGGGGVLAQSIAGAGGIGGSAAAYGVGFFTVAIGSTGGKGGTAGPVTVTNNDTLVATFGDHAVGIAAQSVGGGGGKGGSAFSLTASQFLGTAVSVGGSGGSSGSGGKVLIDNKSQVTTFGPDALGLKAQSIGGGGGDGGSAIATAFAISVVPEVPGVSAAISVGGSGGSGNVGGSVNVTNSGFVATGGHGAYAMLAQSVGGGGGSGGDATASAFTGGAGGDIKVSAAVAVGGSASSGSGGGVVGVSNDGLLATFGQDAPAIFAQSIGGGGGSGGAGDVSAQTSAAEKYSFSASVAVGGRGGHGGVGQAVFVSNRGGIGTRGDASTGILAQSIGGGGGVGGGGVGKANNDALSISVDVGGSGGSGNDSAYVEVKNFNTIVTQGVASAGITAQSIGGGGGIGGKGGATSGGAETAPDIKLMESLKNGLNTGEKTEEIEPGVIKIGPISFDSDDIDPKKISDFVASRTEDAENDDGNATSLSVAVALGGKGGTAGSGNTLLLENAGQVVTTGALSYGITAQSIGGGGGIAGASTASTTNDNTLGFSLAVGGSAGAAGNGGDVTINLQPGGSVTTTGAAAVGVFAQSLGGGGGSATLSGATNEAGLFGGRGLGITVGGGGGSIGTGGKVRVDHQGDLISTTGKNAIGIFGQSIGGGGGVVTTTSTDQLKKGALANIEDKFNISLGFGGAGVQGGDGEEVRVIVTPRSGGDAIYTTGNMAHGILAQSFGAAGGTAIGGKTVNKTSFFVPGSNSGTGNGGPIAIGIARDITTEGAGAYGVLAQSIGGGGALGGDLTNITEDDGPGGFHLLPFNDAPTGSGHRGNGGSVDILFSYGATVQTGDVGLAPAIFAQSLGGGGGHVAVTSDDPQIDQGIKSGTQGGEGTGGPINITIGDANGTARVIANSSDGISAQSDGGQGGAAITVKVSAGSLVQGGGGSTSAIRLRGGSRSVAAPNVIDNAGKIQSTVGAQGGGLWVDRATTLNNTGTFIGEICGPGRVTGGPSRRCSLDSPTAASSAASQPVASDRAVIVNNGAGGMIVAGPVLDLGSDGVLSNRGTVTVGALGQIAETRLVGDLFHQEGGRLLFDVDTMQNTADLLHVEGDVALEGMVSINAISLHKGDATVLSATGDITNTSEVGIESPHLFSYDATVEDKTLTFSTDADFRNADGASSGHEALADHLQGLWDDPSAIGFGTGFASLAGVVDAGAYTEALNVLSGRAISAISAARFDASWRLANSALSCPTFIGDTSAFGESDCGWTRIEGSRLEKDGSGSSIDYDSRATTIMTGGQREIYPGWFLGGAAGYETSRIDSDLGATSVDGDAGIAVLALKREIGSLLLGGAIDVGYGWYDSSRTIDIGGNRTKAKASTNAFNAGLHLRAAYHMPLGDWYMQPSLDVSASYLNLDGYQESGGGAFNLDVSDSDGVIFAATPAMKVGRRFDFDNGSVVNAFVSVGASFMHGNDWSTNARFANAPSGSGGFGTTLETPDTVGRFSAGLDVLNTDFYSIQFQYDADVASEYLSQSARLQVTVKF